MQINKDKATYEAPFLIRIMDAFDCNFYADIFDGGESEDFAKADNFELAKTIADALFITKNFMFENLASMNEMDAGFDIRVYDANHSCVYAAHEKFKKKWIKGAHSLKADYWKIEKKIKPLNKLEEVNRIVSQLSVEQIEKLTDEQVMILAMERPGHPDQFGFLLDIHYFQSKEHLSKTMSLMMNRLVSIENMKEKMRERLASKNEE